MKIDFFMSLQPVLSSYDSFIVRLRLRRDCVRVNRDRGIFSEDYAY